MTRRSNGSRLTVQSPWAAAGRAVPRMVAVARPRAIARNRRRSPISQSITIENPRRFPRSGGGREQGAGDAAEQLAQAASAAFHAEVPQLARIGAGQGGE